MNFAVLTGGGDSSGINDFLYFLAQRLNKEGHSLLGFRNSWQGLVENEAIALDKISLENVRFTPGTMLGTARKNPIKDGQIDLVLANLEVRKVDALIAMGGDDTLGVAAHLAKSGVKVVGVPQTIDDDLRGTDRSLGFATAVRQAAYCVNSVINSNVAHDRDMIVEIMGRDAGWLALATALNTPACACMCPEGSMSMDETFQAMKRYKKSTGKAALAIVAEGIRPEGYDLSDKPKDAFGNIAFEGVSHWVGTKYQEATGRGPRVQILGYLARGGAPVPFDVELAALYANQAVDLILAGKSGEMAAVTGGCPSSLPLGEVIGAKKTIDPEFLTRQLRLLA